MKRIFAVIFLGSIWVSVALANQTISITPETITQGDPVMVTIEGDSYPQQLLLGKESIPIFVYQGKLRALIGIDLLKTPGDYELSVQFANGEIVKKTITVNELKKIEAPLGIPEKLGGNTPASQKNLVNALAKENQSLANIKTGTKAFWTKAFSAPLKKMIVTDQYGYNRKTGVYTIMHKGVDLRAGEGTRVMAMNRGVVRIAHTYQIYGKTIVIDHGLGLRTLYIHLSKIYVNVGELVQPGQFIGLSGQTGYAEQPHLHISVKINGISIDPLRFLDLFKQ